MAPNKILLAIFLSAVSILFELVRADEITGGPTSLGATSLARIPEEDTKVLYYTKAGSIHSLDLSDPTSLTPVALTDDGSIGTPTLHVVFPLSDSYLAAI